VALTVILTAVTAKAAPFSIPPRADGNRRRSRLHACIGILSFAPGETSKTIGFVVNNDAVDEPDESVTIALRVQ